MREIFYLDNSGFLIFHDDIVMIFDYYNIKPEFGIKDIENGVITEDIFKDKKAVYIFSSHKHFDHYNKQIFSFENYHSNVTYILDRGIKADQANKNINFLKEGQIFKDSRLTVAAFGSTDIGISFLVKIGDDTIFHAGDLNFWHWKEESEIGRAHV